jgi:hypothetical protein
VFRCGSPSSRCHSSTFQPSGDPEAAAAGLIADVKLAEFAPLGLGDPANDALQGVLAGGDAAVVAWFRVSIGFEDRDDRFFFMDVESEVECPCRV